MKMCLTLSKLRFTRSIGLHKLRRAVRPAGWVAKAVCDWHPEIADPDHQWIYCSGSAALILYGKRENEPIREPVMADTRTRATQRDKSSPEIHILVAGLLAGLGGMLPNLCRIAGAESASLARELVSGPYWLATGIYFLIAFILCIGFQERRIREAFVLGIAAPALITSFASSRNGPTQPLKLAGLTPVASVFAAEQEENSSVFWREFKRGLGFRVPTNTEMEAQAMLVQRAQVAEEKAGELETKVALAAAELAELARRPVPSCPVVDTKCPRVDDEERHEAPTDKDSEQGRRLNQAFFLAAQLKQTDAKLASELLATVRSHARANGWSVPPEDCATATELASNTVSMIPPGLVAFPALIAQQAADAGFWRAVVCDKAPPELLPGYQQVGIVYLYLLRDSNLGLR